MMTNKVRESAGRPRSAESKDAILNATVELLEKNGYSALTIEGVAAAAGVSKATIYRWWSNKTMLVMDAFLMLLTPQVKLNENASVRENFMNQLKGMAKVFNSTLGRSMLYVISGSESDSEVVETFMSQYLIPRRTEAKRILENGIEHGELRPNIDYDIVLDMIYGPLYFHVLIHKKKLDDSYIETFIEYILKTVQPEQS
ncbi:TetR/AcrR family transcriptional regulator [Paenibacillus faecalis]|uniref:TetR/AcrR family transcriptional regulator n=1 Tax=Paenibacillus faecalis TaxID=2079532 RepID=UPI000D0E7CF8|nr:TetR/AcrR family transcriptional regulator [Paenibacillus faecalis]